MGLRVWNAATVLQPFASNRARVSAGVRNSSPNSFGKPPAESTVRRPPRFTSPCSITIFTPGCSASVVRKTERHSWALSMVYFSETSRIAIGAGSPGPASAISSPVPIPPATPASTDNVIGMGQNRPSAVRISSHTPRQSVSPMKPSSGVKPPMPSITMSPASREETCTTGNRPARSRAAASASPSSIRGRRDAPPCGRTSFAIERTSWPRQRGPWNKPASLIGRGTPGANRAGIRRTDAPFGARIVPCRLDHGPPRHPLTRRRPPAATIGRCSARASSFLLSRHKLGLSTEWEPGGRSADEASRTLRRRRCAPAPRRVPLPGVSPSMAVP